VRTLGPYLTTRRRPLGVRRRAFALIGFALLAGCASGDAETLPDVEIADLTSGDVSLLSDIDGPAVINLWATWCTPCRAEIPAFEEVHQARGDEVRFVGINVGEDPERALSFLDEVGATYGQFSDQAGDVSTELRATSMPLTVVIDADGVVSTRHLGPLDRDGLDRAIDDALAG
jgi:thiol-disulfide isomerase/thioredoxin